MKREKSIKILKILFKYNFTIKLPKNAIIIMTMIFHDFRWLSGGRRWEGPLPVRGNLGTGWAPFQQPNSFQELFNMQNTKYTSWIMQEWRDTKKQDANYENTKNQGCNTLSLQRRNQEKDRGNPSQPGGPSSRGQRIRESRVRSNHRIVKLKNYQSGF